MENSSSVKIPNRVDALAITFVC